MKMLLEIKKKGDKFIPEIFRCFKLIQLAVFQTAIFMYDPNLEGLIEKIEGQIDQEITNILLQDQLYFLLLVFARIERMHEDQSLRHNIHQLRKTTPFSFGVSKYLLLNQETPILDIAKSQDELGGANPEVQEVSLLFQMGDLTS